MEASQFSYSLHGCRSDASEPVSLPSYSACTTADYLLYLCPWGRAFLFPVVAVQIEPDKCCVSLLGNVTAHSTYMSLVCIVAEKSA